MSEWLTQSNNPWVCKRHEQVQIARKGREAPRVCNRGECYEPRGSHCCPCACLHRIPSCRTLLLGHRHRILAAEDCSMQGCSDASLTLTNNERTKNNHRQIGTRLIKSFSKIVIGKARNNIEKLRIRKWFYLEWGIERRRRRLWFVVYGEQAAFKP